MYINSKNYQHLISQGDRQTITPEKVGHIAASPYMYIVPAKNYVPSTVLYMYMSLPNSCNLVLEWLEQFSVECPKNKTKVITLANQRDANGA